MANPLRCKAHTKPPNGKVEFLLITDQRDSSRNPHNEVGPRTERHFTEFISSLSQAAKVVKNIGDSLMIHVQIEKKALLNFLDKAIAVKIELGKGRATGGKSSKHREAVPIRMVIVYLDPKEYLLGQEIPWLEQGNGRNIEKPSKRLADCVSWLCGDLFGSSIALAFRAAGVPKQDVVVIDNRLLTKAGIRRANGTEECFERTANGRKLHFGPALAFSPFKGLEKIYEFGGKGPVAGSSWKGHLFLRMLGRDKKEVRNSAGNPLILDQQKIRVFTEIVWIGEAPNAEVRAMKDALEEKQRGAGYVRRYASVVERKEFPEASLSHEADVILIGAYPNAEAYYTIREELEKIRNDRKAKFAYPVTNDVYPDASEMKTAFWVPNEVSSRFLLIFARWRKPDRMELARIAENRINDAIRLSGKRGQLTLHRCGLLQGNLWDVYATLNLKSNGAAPIVGRDLELLCYALERESFAAATVQLCKKIK